MLDIMFQKNVELYDANKEPEMKKDKARWLRHRIFYYFDINQDKVGGNQRLLIRMRAADNVWHDGVLILRDKKIASSQIEAESPLSKFQSPNVAE